MELARRRLTQWRIDRGETQKAIGDLIGWDQATVSKFELGRQDATVDQLDILAHHYQRSLSELFADMEPLAADPVLAEWVGFYWRLSAAGRRAHLEAWRETVPKKTRPSGAARRSVKREFAPGAARPREGDEAGPDKSKKSRTRR